MATTPTIMRAREIDDPCSACGKEKRFGELSRCLACVKAEAARARESREAAEARTAAKKPKRETATKACRTCKEPKSVDEFGRHAIAKDGHRHDCRECVRAGKVKKHPVLSLDEKLADKARRAKAHRRAANRQSVREWTQRNPQAAKARAAVSQALKAGRLARPTKCQVRTCKSTGKPQAHHRDYAYPLDVLWCCPGHHRKAHAGEILELHGLPPALACTPQTNLKEVRSEKKARARVQSAASS